MKKFYNSKWLLSASLLIISFNGMSQMPDPTYFYHHSGTTIYNYNTATSGTSVNTISLPSGSSGFAVNNNFFAASPAMTFYTTNSNNFYYYNGSSWVNTGHFRGHTSAVNIGGAGPYIYNLNGVGKQVYKYDGTGAATLLMNLPATWGGPYDCTGDASGNFYIMTANTSPGSLTQYDPLGNVVAVYSMIGFPTSTAGGGFAFIGGKLYATIGSTNVWGTISGSTITYGGPLTLGGGTSDYANWPLPIVPLPVQLLSFDGIYNSFTGLNEINWTTVSEINNSHFILEFSNNGADWEYHSRIEGHGNSNNTIEYPTVFHDSPYEVTYYRLSQYDFDEKVEYFDPIVVHQPYQQFAGGEVSFQIFPNPATDFIVVEASANVEFDYRITDEMGRIVYLNKIHGTNHTINVAELRTGLYFINIDADGHRIHQKFIKN